MKCPKCGSPNIVKNGKKTLSDGKHQAYLCKDQGHVFYDSEPIKENKK